MSYLNGISYPKFEIADAGGRVHDTIILPLTNSKGLIENYEEMNIVHTFLDYHREKKILGYNVNFTLYFDEYVSKSTAQKIRKLLDWEAWTFNQPQYAGYKIWLTPRVDVPSRKFHVIGKNESLTMAIMRGGAGHKGIILNYTTKYLSYPNWLDPATENFIIAKNKYII